ncbi:MAG TPA: alpha/beta hydrolase [Candidatus Omnitrophota bacterium]|nr:alpha/beta hydrolase [Candidatus Omnitrophota bacterium]
MLKWILNLMITSMIFFPEKKFDAAPQEFGLQAETVECLTQDAVKLHGWFFEAPGSEATLLFFHGNAGNISHRLYKTKGWLDRKISVFLIDYRGYGKSEGKIEKEADLYRDAEAALKWLREIKKIRPEDIILYGESIGSAPAIELARREPFRGIVLEAPFTSLGELAKAHYSWVPESWLSEFRLDNFSKIREIRSPLLIIQGDEDEICPFAMGEKLFGEAPGRKEFFRVAGGHHNDLPEIAGEAYYDVPARFLPGGVS